MLQSTEYRGASGASSHFKWRYDFWDYLAADGASADAGDILQQIPHDIAGKYRPTLGRNGRRNGQKFFTICARLRCR